MVENSLDDTKKSGYGADWGNMFIVNDRLWSSGIGGSLPSIAAFVFGAVGIAKIFWSSGLFSTEGNDGPELCWAGWLAAAAQGQLHHPGRMPEGSPEGSWRKS